MAFWLLFIHDRRLSHEAALNNNDFYQESIITSWESDDKIRAKQILRRVKWILTRLLWRRWVRIVFCCAATLECVIVVGYRLAL